MCLIRECYSLQGTIVLIDPLSNNSNGYVTNASLVFMADEDYGKVDDLLLISLSKPQIRDAYSYFLYLFWNKAKYQYLDEIQRQPIEVLPKFPQNSFKHQSFFYSGIGEDFSIELLNSINTDLLDNNMKKTKSSGITFSNPYLLGLPATLRDNLLNFLSQGTKEIDFRLCYLLFNPLNFDTEINADKVLIQMAKMPQKFSFRYVERFKVGLFFTRVVSG